MYFVFFLSFGCGSGEFRSKSSFLDIFVEVVMDGLV